MFNFAIKARLTKQIKKRSYSFGFDDVRFVRFENENYILLFKKYTPAIIKKSKDRIAVSEYYLCSNFVYFAVRELTEELNSTYNLGASTAQDIHLKKLALFSGGTLGLSSLYFHETLGSFVCIQAIKVNKNLSKKKKGVSKSCQKCLNCVAACPTGAISIDGFNREKCLRNMMSEKIDEQHRKKVYQLLGCDICQVVCPQNHHRRKEPTSFDLLCVLKGEETKNIKALCGANYGKRTRVVSQAICYAVSQNATSSLDDISKLLNDQNDTISKYAKWAVRELK
jgi:epoxyqueuosine reductase QueG